MKHRALFTVLILLIVPMFALSLQAEERPFKITAENKKAATCKKDGVRLSIKPTGVFKINMEYPWKVTVKGDSTLSFAKDTLRKTDAVTFKETLAEFDVCYAPSAGASAKGKIEMLVKFSVCEKKRCLMFREPVTYEIK